MLPPPAEKLQNFFGVFLQFQIGVDITEILKESAHQMKKCVIVVTHSGELAKQADVVFRLKKGELQIEQSEKSS